jgi:hypothetical protein
LVVGIHQAEPLTVKAAVELAGRHPELTVAVGDLGVPGQWLR